MNFRIMPLMLVAVFAIGGAPRADAAKEFSETRLIVKFRARPNVVETSPGVLKSGNPAMDELFRRFDVGAVERLFPRVTRHPELRDRLGLDRYHVVTMRRPADIPAAVAAFAN